MVLKCEGCWQNEPHCSCGPFGTSPVKDACFVVLELPYHPLRRVSTIKLAHDAKYLENLQRMKILEEMDKKMEGKS